ncbi:MAG: TonB-dependent receptor [Acetobacter sp.]|uniref:TonB-dependent receptor n=1 Tax=Acetobacter sp. TaxID=440 RepID=UPI0039ED7B94
MVRKRLSVFHFLLAGTICGETIPTEYAAARDTTLPAKATKAANSSGVVKKPVVSRPRSVKASGPGEAIHVTGRTASPQGVTGRQPGGGLMRLETRAGTIQSVTRDFIAKQPPSANPVQVLSLTPSAFVTLTEPYGIAGGNLTLRGLPGDHVGWIYNGAPVNDVGDGGFYANQTSDGDNLKSVSLTPGSVDIDTPSISAAAGAAYADLIDPSHKRGGFVDFSYGSYDMHREFVRLETGDIGKTGVRAFASFSNTAADNWRGPGKFTRKHVDFKLIKDFTPESRWTINASYNTNQLQLDMYPTKDQFAQYGKKLDYSSHFNKSNPTDYYKYGLDAFQNLIASAPLSLKLADGLRFDDTPYLWWGSGTIGGVSTIEDGQTFSGNQPVDVNVANGTTVYSPLYFSYHRTGNNAKVTWTKGINTLTFGWWYEWSRTNQATPVSYINQNDGGPANIYGDYGPNIYRLANGKKWYLNNHNTFTQVNMLYLGDKLKLLNDKLELQAGVRLAMVSRKVNSYVPNIVQNRGQNVFEPLPQFSASYTFNSHHQLYLRGSTSFKMPNNNTMFELYNVNGSMSTAPSDNVKPEYSINEEIGYRYHDDIFVGDISFFNYNFTNRQMAVLSYFGSAPMATTMNVGNQTSRGVDVQLATRPIFGHFRPYVSFEYLDATVDSDIHYLNDYLRTKGKRPAQTPHEMGALGVDWDNGHIFLDLNLKYVGSQYATLLNDEKLHPYISDSLTVGYRFSNVWYLHSPQIQLNFQNLAGSLYRNGVYSMTPFAHPTTGVYGTQYTSASAPTYTLAPPLSVSFSMSTGF